MTMYVHTYQLLGWETLCHVLEPFYLLHRYYMYICSYICTLDYVHTYMHI